MANIIGTENWMEISRVIFEDFEVNQSCTIYGCVQVGDDFFTKGEMVLKELERLDIEKNTMCNDRRGTIRRKRTKLENSIGGFIAQKIFKFKGPEVIDGKTRWTIWRYQ